MPTSNRPISPELPDSSNFGASPTVLDYEDPRGASRPGARDTVDAAGLTAADIARKDAGGTVAARQLDLRVNYGGRRMPLYPANPLPEEKGATTRAFLPPLKVSSGVVH